MNWYSIPPLVVSILTLLLGLFVCLKNMKVSQNRTYLFVCMSISLWLFSASMLFSSPRDEKIITFWAKMVFVGVTFIPINFYHFVVSFLKIRNQKNVVRVAYLIGLVFMAFLLFTNLYISGGNEFFWGYYPKAGILHPLDVSLFMLLYVGSLWLMFKKIREKGIDSQQKNRMKYALAAFFIAMFAVMDFIPNYGYEIYPFGYIFIFTMLLIIAYAIVRHKLMDIEVMIKKTLIFAGLFTVVYAVFAFFAFLGQIFFEKFITANRWISMIPSIIMVTMTLRPLENLLINITDKYLFQKKYDYKELLKTFTSEVLTVLDLDRLIGLTKEKLMEIMKLKSCELVLSGPIFPDDEGALKLPISVGEIASVASLPRNDGVIGTLILGRKKSDEDYTQEDLDILHPLAKALGIAISNAKLFNEIARTQAEMAQKDKMATIGTLAAGMAHEIRNPITTIRNFADYLPEKRNDDGFVGKFNKLVPGEIDRIESVARSLLEFSSAEDMNAEEELAIDEPMRTVIAILEPQYRTSEISIICNSSGRHFVRGNRVQLQDAFFNILNYILAESEKGSSIFVECAENKAVLSLFIRNKGLIVADHIIKDVFEPVSGLYKEKRGFGFNLFVAKQLIERNNGLLTISSNKTTGSEFCIEFKKI